MASLRLIAKFTVLNDVSNSFPPQISLGDLEVGKTYKIWELKAVDTPKYGRSILAQVHVPKKRREDGDDLHSCFLPRRFVSLFTDREISRYNASPDLGVLFLGYGKKCEFLVQLVEDWS